MRVVFLIWSNTILAKGAWMLYEADGTRDLVNVLAAIDGFAEGLGLSDLNVDVDQVEAILRGMRQDFPAQGGTDGASPFKKAANFLCYFVAQRPIKNPFPEEVVGGNISRIPNHQNVMVGLHIAIDALNKATIHREDQSIELTERVKMSAHSYVDTVQACSQLVPMTHFHLVSVFLEQICYRFNPDASYELIDI